jgi:hypothetical protein
MTAVAVFGSVVFLLAAGVPGAGGQAKEIPSLLALIDDPRIWCWQAERYETVGSPVFNPRTGRVVWHVRSKRVYDEFTPFAKSLAATQFDRYGPRLATFLDEDGVIIESVRLNYQGPEALHNGQAYFLVYLDVPRVRPATLKLAVRVRVESLDE